MAVNCELLLSADIVRDCDLNPVAGLEVNVLIGNIEDLDRSGTVIDATNDLLITDLKLKPGKKMFKLEGVKQSNSSKEELVIKDYANAYKHTFSGVILTASVENRKSLEQLMAGGRFFMVIEKLWKGTGSKDAFDVSGFDVGMTASSKTWDSKENDGVEVFELSSADGFEEPKPRRSLLETDYATTKQAFDAGFQTA